MFGNSKSSRLIYPFTIHHGYGDTQGQAPRNSKGTNTMGMILTKKSPFPTKATKMRDWMLKAFENMQEGRRITDPIIQSRKRDDNNRNKNDGGH